MIHINVPVSDRFDLGTNEWSESETFWKRRLTLLHKWRVLVIVMYVVDLFIQFKWLFSCSFLMDFWVLFTFFMWDDMCLQCKYFKLNEFEVLFLILFFKWRVIFSFWFTRWQKVNNDYWFICKYHQLCIILSLFSY